MTDAMIAPATRELAPGLVPDLELPARDLLIDPTFVAGRLARLLAKQGILAVEACELVRVKYRVGESLRVVYRLRAGGRDRLVTGRMFRAGRSQTAYERAIARDPSPLANRSRQVCHDPAYDVVWWCFPRDRKLGDLGWLTSPSAALTHAVGLPEWRRTEVVQYVPERSVTALALDDHATTLAYAKTYGPTTVPTMVAARLRHVAGELRRTGRPVTAPTAIGWSPARRLLLMEAMPGRSWNALAGEDLGRAMTGLGVAIACLHESTPADGLEPFGRLRPDRVQRSVDLVARARPDVAAHLELVTARLRVLTPPAEPQVALHGDCHPGNALVDGDTISLIDLDQMGRGPAAADLGSLFGRLRYAATVGELGTAEVAELEARFVAGYAAQRPLPAADSLAWHTAAALLAERALRAVNRVNETGLARLDPIVDAADTALTRGVLP